MSVSFAGSRSITSGSSNVTTQSILLPGGWQNDDICLWFGEINDVTVALTLPSGWTFLDTTPYAMSSSRLWVAWRRMGAGAASPTVSIASPGCKVTQAMALYRGVSTTSPPVAGTRGTRAASGATTVSPGITTTEANEVVAHIFMEKSTSSTTISLAPVGATQRLAAFGSGGGEVSVACYDEVIATAGATGTRTATYDVASTVGYAVSIAFPAAPPAPPSTGTTTYTLMGGSLAPRATYLMSGGVLAD